ncbi:hypothetical protein OH77DRAFT_1521747 [Trametes cingulata]|nr:hypothetical protein OH77DRAFT_1521747 [Trametes cingulata]
MVHRPADSRLLANLLSHEKDYSKHLSTLLEYSHSSLASFSAFAAACAPPTSQVIIAVAGALAGADDALRNYAAAVERWQEQLKALKDMEDDVGNIMRDREILVTRLIKASKQQKPARDSVLGGSPSGSSLSITKPEVHVGQKLSAAQAELQACEAHLAAKEQELNAFRTHTIKSGLQARCQAMAECGWAWSEMGKEGIRALDTLDMANGHGSPLAHPYLHKPLPGYEKAGSDISSIAPSQSASQIGHSSGPSTLVDSSWRSSSPLSIPTPPKPYTLQIPPAHSIGEFVLPNGTLQHATIEEEVGGGSSAEEDETATAVEVRENPRFSKRKPKAKTAPPPPAPPSRHVSFSLRGPKASTSESLTGEPSSLRGDSPNKRSRTRAGSVFGSLAALFHVGGSRNEPEDPLRTSPSKTQGRWQTRIDRNLASVRRGDSSDDDLPALSHSYGPRTASPAPILLNSPGKESPGNAGDPHRLKKRSLKRGSVQAPSPARMVDTEKGYASDTVTESVSKARAKSNRQKAHTRLATEMGANGSAKPSPPKKSEDPGVGPSGSSARLKKSPNTAVTLLAEGQTSLSRNSSISKQSITSSASAPPRTSSASHVSSPSPLGRQGSVTRKRTASLDVSASAQSSPSVSTPTKHKRTVSTSGAPSTTRTVLTTGEPSLMSIVEGISRINKDAAVKQDPNRLLVVPKAPGPINVTIGADLGETSTASQGRSEGCPSARPRLKREGQSEESNYRNSLLMSASVSAPSLPIETASQPKPLPAKMPLRSALRNASRTPSPNPPQPHPKPVIAAAPTPATNGKLPATRNEPASAIPRSATSSTITPEIMAKRRESDISSISSYETGREVLDDEPSPPGSPVVPPPPPHHDEPAGGSELSHSTASTSSTASPPVRRKSVRMSLPPTFSATPPALDETDDDDEEGHRHEPWSSRAGSSTPRAETGGWGSRIEQNGARDVWQDSSDEDAEYSAAKRLLTRLSRKHEH